MPGTARFHDKLHRANHHTLSSAGLPDSSYDPIASPDKPFQGDFHLNGSLSSNNIGYFSALQSASGLTVSGGTTVSTATFTGSVTMQETLTVSSTGTNYINGGIVVGRDVVLAGATNRLSAPVLSSLSATIGSGIFTTLLASTARVTDKLGVGVNAIDPTRKLHVLGDVLIEGNLSATGSSSFQNTDFATSDAIDITNSGTTDAVRVTQNGNFGILALYDGAAPAFWVDANNSRPGHVGVGTITPNEKLTVVGNISSTNLLYARGARLTDLGLEVGGTTNLDGQLNVTTQRATFSNSIDVYQASNFYQGALTVHDGLVSQLSGSFVRNGLTVDTGGITVGNGNVTVNTGSLSVLVGGATINGGLTASGTTQLASLSTTGAATIAGTLTVNDNVSANSNLHVGGRILSGGVDLLELFAAGTGGDGGGGGGGTVEGTLTTGNIELTGASVALFNTQTLTATGDFLVININNRERKIRLWD